MDEQIAGSKRVMDAVFDPECGGAYPYAQQIADMKAIYEPLEEIAGRLAHIFQAGVNNGEVLAYLNQIGVELDNLAEWCQQNHPDWQG